jgi:glyoxylase-like metal-dependent hydrolase (beta-lactamase superfamily II)
MKKNVRIDMRLPWFEVEPVAKGVTSISEPGHYEYVRSYLVIGERQAVLIDTGTGIDDIRPLIAQRTSLPVQVILTHTHWDHAGNAHRFERVALFDHEKEYNRLKNGYKLSIEEELRPKNFGRPTPPGFNPATFEIPRVENATRLKDGELIDLGGRTLEVIHTPGHSPGSICLWDAHNALLFTGDTFYWGPLYGYQDEFDIESYARTADRLVVLTTRAQNLRVLPGHNEIEIEHEHISEKDILKLQDVIRSILVGDHKPDEITARYKFGRFSINMEV